MSNTRYSCQSLMKLEFSRQIFENAQISSFMKIGPVEAETDTRTDLKKLIVAFRNLRTRLINAQSLQKVTPCTSSDG